MLPSVAELVIVFEEISFPQAMEGYEEKRWIWSRTVGVTLPPDVPFTEFMNQFARDLKRIYRLDIEFLQPSDCMNILNAYYAGADIAAYIACTISSAYVRQNQFV